MIDYSSDKRAFRLSDVGKILDVPHAALQEFVKKKLLILSPSRGDTPSQGNGSPARITEKRILQIETALELRRNGVRTETAFKQSLWAFDLIENSLATAHARGNDGLYDLPLVTLLASLPDREDGIVFPFGPGPEASLILYHPSYNIFGSNISGVTAVTLVNLNKIDRKVRLALQAIQDERRSQ